MNERIAKQKVIFGAIAAALVLAAALLLLLEGGRKAPVFAEFSEAGALDGSTDCYLNALQILDRYAEEPDKAEPDELLLASFRDRDETEVLLSLLVASDEPLYRQLSPYFAESDQKTELAVLSGYFFCEPLNRHNKSAVNAFAADADDYIAWRDSADPGVKNPVVLRFAGETEAAYEAACRAKYRGTAITVLVLLALAIACGVRILFLRENKARQRLQTGADSGIMN